MKFCSECGSRRIRRDLAHKFVCADCGAVFYQNPRLVAGCIAQWQGRILLCRRAVEPGYGLWSLPAGFVEKGEPCAKSAGRETLEEAGAVVEIDRLYALFHIPSINQVHLVFLADLVDGALDPGGESSEVRFFDEADVPWTELAFTTTHGALRQYFRDRRSGDFGFHFEDIVPFPY